MSDSPLISNDPFTVNNDNLTVVVTKKPHCVVHFDIKVAPIATEAAYRRACKNVRKEVNIPGFRKGHAPETMVLAKYQTSIQQEFVDLVLNTAFQEAIDLTHLRPMHQQTVRRPVVHSCLKESGAHIAIEFETQVQVPSIDLTTLKLVKSLPVPVTENEREIARKNYALQFATYEPIEDRPIQQGDFIDVTITLLIDPPKEIASNQRTEVSPKNFPEWLFNKIIGLKANESFEGMSEQTKEELAEDFSPIPYRVQIHSLFKGNIPAIDENLAEKVKAPSAQTIFNHIDRSLEFQASEKAAQANIESLEHFLATHYHFDLPESLIDANTKWSLDNHIKSIQAQGLTLSNDELQHSQQMIRKQVIDHNKVRFLLQKAISENNITVDNVEMAEELQRQISHSANGINSIDWSNQVELEKKIRQMAIQRKIRQFLIDKSSEA